MPILVVDLKKIAFSVIFDRPFQHILVIILTLIVFFWLFQSQEMIFLYQKKFFKCIFHFFFCKIAFSLQMGEEEIRNMIINQVCGYIQNLENQLMQTSNQLLIKGNFILL